VIDPHLDDERLIAYVLGEMDDRDRLAVDGHLEACRDCRAKADSLALVVASEREARSKPASARVLIELLGRQARIRSEPRTLASRRSLVATVAVAVGLVLFGTGFFAGRRSVGAPRSVESPSGAQLRPPLPPAPRIAFEGGRALGGELAFASWPADIWEASPGDSGGQRDSL
jgi:anti-sigma factor RsiW